MSARDSTRRGAFDARCESKSAPDATRAEQKTVTLGAQFGIEIGLVETGMRARAKHHRESFERLRGRRNEAPNDRVRT